MSSDPFCSISRRRMAELAVAEAARTFMAHWLRFEDERGTNWAVQEALTELRDALVVHSRTRTRGRQ